MQHCNKLVLWVDIVAIGHVLLMSPLPWRLKNALHMLQAQICDVASISSRNHIPQTLPLHVAFETFHSLLRWPYCKLNSLTIRLSSSLWTDWMKCPCHPSARATQHSACILLFIRSINQRHDFNRTISWFFKWVHTNINIENNLSSAERDSHLVWWLPNGGLL